MTAEIEAPERAGFGELRIGDLGVRIARSPAEIDAVQALRFRVFYEEMGATPNPVTLAIGRDRDAFDAVADHLVVVDHAIGPGPEGVATSSRWPLGDSRPRCCSRSNWSSGWC